MVRQEYTDGSLTQNHKTVQKTPSLLIVLLPPHRKDEPHAKNTLFWKNTRVALNPCNLLMKKVAATWSTSVKTRKKQADSPRNHMICVNKVWGPTMLRHFCGFSDEKHYTTPSCCSLRQAIHQCEGSRLQEVRCYSQRERKGFAWAISLSTVPADQRGPTPLSTIQIRMKQEVHKGNQRPIFHIVLLKPGLQPVQFDYSCLSPLSTLLSHVLP